jgi:hypothetical protein
MLAVVIAMRWFHEVSKVTKIQPPETLSAEKEEAIISWQVTRKERVISIFERERAS